MNSDSLYKPVLLLINEDGHITAARIVENWPSMIESLTRENSWLNHTWLTWKIVPGLEWT
jgi:hypothetical protein